MHTSKDDYLINTLRFVSRKEASQKYGAVLPECLTSPEMKESKAYKTYLAYATGAVPFKVTRKFKKASLSKKDSVPVQADKETVQKGKRVKRATKKSLTTPAAVIIIREPPVQTKSKGKAKEKVDVAHGKGIELLYDVALTEEALIKEVRKKSLRDFHRSHPGGLGTTIKKPLSVEKITPTVTSEGTGDKPGVPDMTKDDSTESESDDEQESDSKQDEEFEDDDQEEEEFDDENESEDDDQAEEEFDDEDKFVDDEIKSDEEKGMDVQGEGKDAEMTDVQQGNANLETTQEQVVDDAHVTITTVLKKTEVPITSFSRSSDLASKFLNFSDIPHGDAEIVSPLDVQVHHEVPRTQAPTLLIIPVSVITDSSPVYTNIPQSSQTFTPLPIQTTPIPLPTIGTTNPPSTLPNFAYVFRFNDRIVALENEVAELTKDPLHTQVTTLVDEHLDTRLGETREAFMNFLSESLTTRIKEQMKKSGSYLAAPKHRECYDSLKKSYDLDKDFFYFYDVYTLKRGREDKDKDEDPSAGSDRGLKK
ncbi:hypothetical protein Tco_0966101 [Tanacetum coccineum]